MGNEVIYNWTFSNNKNRGKLWYVIVLSIIIGLVIWGFLTRQYVLSFVIILIVGVSFFIENNSEENSEVYITNLGIKVNNSFFDYSKISSYCFIYEGENCILLRLNLIKKGLKTIDLNVNNDIVLTLKEILPKFITEDEKGELDFIDKIIRFLKL